MSGYEPRSFTLFRQKLAELKKSRTDALARGAPVDYAAYRELIGVLAGIDAAEVLLEETISDVNKGES